MEKREQIAELQEFFGYCLIRSTDYDCCLILIGPRASGKSTTLKVLKMLVGPRTPRPWTWPIWRISFTGPACSARS